MARAVNTRRRTRPSLVAHQPRPHYQDDLPSLQTDISFSQGKMRRLFLEILLREEFYKRHFRQQLLILLREIQYQVICQSNSLRMSYTTSVQHF